MAHTARSNDLAEWAARNLAKTRQDSEGPWLTACCPLHEDSTASLRMNTETGGYICQAGCGQGTVRELAKQAGLPAPPDRPQNPKQEPEADFLYETAAGEPYARVTRWPGKQFRQGRWEAGKWIPKAPAQSIPYNLPALAQADSSTLVFWVEGEKDVDAATRRGLLATTSPGGAGAFGKLDPATLEVLAGRTVIVIPDNDEAGRAYAREVGTRLARVGATVRYLSLPDLPAKGDLSDWFAAGGTAEDLLHLAELAGDDPPPHEEPDSAPARTEEAEEGGNQAKRLLALAADFELFHTSDREAYASVLQEGPAGLRRENHRVGSSGMRSLLTLRFYAAEGKPPTDQALRGALGVLEARAIHEGTELPVFVRVAECGDSIYLDLANDGLEAVRVTKLGWELTSDPPVRFIRPRGLLAIPRPEQGGSLEDLRPFLNLSSTEDFALAVGWLLDTLQPATPFPVLCLEGEQGSGKTSMARKLRALLDPNKSPVRRLPSEKRDLAISATNAWILAFDNLSGMTEEQSNNLCCVSTGGGLSTRALYQNDEEALFYFTRPVILTGIAGVTGRADLGDRTVILTLPVIREQDRRSERDLEQAFEAARPRIIGALLTAVSTGLRNRDSVKLERKPRMADFAEWVVACEPACPWPPGTFLRAYAGNRAEMVEATLQGNPVAMAVRKLLDRIPEWQGTSSKLLEALEGLLEERERRVSGWPKGPSPLSKRLREAATFLRAVGIEVDFGKSNHPKTITIERISAVPSLASLPSQVHQPSHSERDGMERAPVPSAYLPSHEVAVTGREGREEQAGPMFPSLPEARDRAGWDVRDGRDGSDLPGQGVLVEDLLG